MSFFTWIYPAIKYGPILNFETELVNKYGLHSFVEIVNGAPYFYLAVNSRNNPSDYVHIKEPITPNTWTYVGVTYDHNLGELKYYKDGVFIKEYRNNWKIELITQYKVSKGEMQIHNYI